MQKTFASLIKPLLKSLVAIALVVTLVFGHASTALAAGGGRIGGGSFRAPSRVYRPSPRSYSPGAGSYSPYPGRGIGMPFVFPSPLFFVGGGGGLFTVILFIMLASFLVQTFRRGQADDELGYGATDDQTITVTKLQVGLLANARELQADLNKLALKADTSSGVGLANVLQETSLALLRHPEYWVYGGASTQPSRLALAEAEFNRLALAERSKFSGETLSNVNSQLLQAEPKALLTDANGELVESAASPGEYIIVTVLAATQGALKLPPVNNETDMKQVLQQLGGVAGDRLLALEVLWTPQAEGDVLTSEDVLEQYPTLKLI